VELDRYKDLLVERRQELTGHLSVLEDTLDETPSKDWEDRASERQGDEVFEAMGQIEIGELRRIDAALLRLKEGTYGICQECGKDILEARLDLLPDTPFCKDCAK